MPVAKRCPKCGSFLSSNAKCFKCGYDANKEDKTPKANAPVIEEEYEEEIIEEEYINDTDYESMSLSKLEAVFNAREIDLPDFDYEKEDLINILQQYDQGQEYDLEDEEIIDEEYEDEEYEESDENIGEIYDDDMDYEDTEITGKVPSKSPTLSSFDKDSDDNEEDDDDYSSMSIEQLKMLCDKRDIEYMSKDKKAKLIMYLCRYDEASNEAEPSDAEELDYSSMSVSELKTLCDKRDIEYMSKDGKSKLIMYLCQYDEANSEEESNELDEIDFSSMSVSELKAFCDDYDIEYSSKATRSKLLELLEEYFGESSGGSGTEYEEDDEEYLEEDDEEAFYDYENLKVSELKALCDERDIFYRQKARKSELIGLLQEYDDEVYEDEEYEDTESQEDSRSTFSKLFGKGNSLNQDHIEEETDITTAESDYDPNYDHYYDDVLPEVIAEMERIPKDAILKAIGCIFMIFAAIIFLIYYF